MSQRLEGRRAGRWLSILVVGCAALLFIPKPAPAQETSTFMAHAAKASAGCRASEAFQVAPQQRAVVPPEFRDTSSTVTTRADSQQKVGDTYKLLGHVEVTYRDLRLSSDEATYNRATGDVAAQGHVIFDARKAHFKTDSVQYNVLSGQGSFSNVEGYVHSSARPRTRALVTENPFFVRAREVRRLDEDTYEVENGRVSSCQDEATGWSLAVRRARLKVDDNAVSYGAVFRLLRVPVFYAPVLADSIARNPRHTGFLLPQIGNSSQKGAIVGDGFFWAINPSADLLLGLENYSKRGLERSGRFRARPSSTSEITVDYFGIHDRGLIAPITTTTTPGATGATTIGRVSASGDSVRAVGKSDNLFAGFRGVLDVDYINSPAFRLTFSNNFNQAISSETRQTGFLTKNFDGYSLDFFAERYQDFLSTQQGPGNSIVIQHTPSAQFSSLDRQIGSTPLFWSFDSSVDGLVREEPRFSTPALSERLDFHPEVSLRTKRFAGFQFTPSLGADATRYGTSLLGGHRPLTRLLGDFSFDLRPPSLDRVFDRRFHHYRLKHVIEPDINYRLVRSTDAEDIADIVRFDETDILAETNEIEYSVKSTLYGKADDANQPDGTSGTSTAPQARALLSLSLTQKYYFDPTFGGVLAPGRNVFEPTLDLTPFPFAQGRRLSPVVSVLKFAPFSNYDTEVRADFSPSGGVLNAGITSAVHRGDFSLQATDFFISREQNAGFSAPPTGAASPSFNLLNARVVYGNASRKGLSAALGINYNLSTGATNALVGQVTYNLGCLGLDVGYNRFNLGPLRDENQFRIALSLANVGSFGNLRSRDRLYR